MRERFQDRAGRRPASYGTDRTAVHGRRRRHTASLNSERLERREMFAADLAALPLSHAIQWQGAVVEARIDSWVVRTATSSMAALALGENWRAADLGEGFYQVTAPGASVADVSAWASRTPAVSFFEPDFVIEPTATPNDPSFGQLWGLNNTGQSGGLFDADIDAPEAWNVTTGSRNVVVAVIDTGVDYTHPDLAANAWRNPGEIPGDRIDNDRNGFVDDVYGWDFRNNDGNPMDDQGHGTHVAGTIGAVGNNGTGVSGVAWQVSIMALKFLGADGSGSTSGAVAAINYATRMKRDFGINIVATNNSWGGGGASTSLRDAIAAGGQAGILFVAAAGNESNNNDASPSYPASDTSDAVLSVAATDRSNRLASFSNYGLTSVDLAAPGVSILSTTPGNTYASYSGTSMATPHVTGAVALLAAANPQATASQIRSAILSSSVPVAALAGKVATGGLLNVAGALAALGGTPPTPPPPPPPSAGPYEPNDSIGSAAPLSIEGGTVIVSATVGDSAAGAADVDLFAVSLVAGSTFSVDIDAGSLATPSSLDSYVRVFNAAGTQVAFNDDADGSLDSFLSFTVPATGTYCVGVSAYGNGAYNPLVAGGGSAGDSTGSYTLRLTTSEPPPPPTPTLTADILDVSPDPRTTSVEGVIVTFSAAVSGFDASDLVLTRDGSPVSLGGVTVTTTDGIRWTVAGLASATTTAGAYRLVLTAATSGIVALDGTTPLSADASDSWTTTAAQLVDAGDTLATAAPIVVSAGGVRLSGRVGDGAYGGRDVDLYRFTLTAGQQIVIDIDARSLAGSSTLDSYLRLFDARGRQVATNDDSNGSFDSLITFTARTSGTYFVGVSGYGNSSYSPTRAGSGRVGSTGVYQVAFSATSAAGSTATTRTMGFRDGRSSATASAFAMYGTNWQAALPSFVNVPASGPRRPAHTTGR